MTIGQILDEFFSPLSKPTLWVMPENDNYTKIVREWQPVIDAVGRIKDHLSRNCAVWSASYRSNPSWAPTMTNTPKANAHREFVPSPPGTDPVTCRDAFIVYVTSKAARLAPVPGNPFPIIGEVQTRNLYTCSIGSFNIYTTVDSIDCGAKRATMNFWMYNAMSRTSFGRFASNPVFWASGMETQFMWWNWVETVEWTTGAVRTVPKTGSGGGWGS